MKTSFCPECKQVLKNRNVCNCGWRETVTEETDHYCHYRALGRRCKYFGTICHAPYGSKWYCTSHYRVFGDARLCEGVLIESERHIKNT